ncbi:MAG TPA: ABC transporter ATP-binding protein/permease [Bacilli bacterium]|nr:ABC transporter ATP-binding protein/permease [Bacilli bacterium]HPA98809.1 ABC transporter ATP-binding protein/permease [Bacilli bacterium]HPX83225.1 ABC transporter ATP-binding protein/permease [Bacilli bacterium]HQO93911.1 ABC transporter ATP-binding protein/permease [Bacilli bacterium]HQQ39162.1 ABC transporter ATP-binding protein/permease [Bacilli bacterium]
MLRLENITKDYKVSWGKVHALRGINLSFRKAEFVSILGPSGCGKTTLLNIIGGLDHYTSGNLYIDGIPTDKFIDRDFDTYRNHRIGFVFQSYNLIPHQTVLENVELSLNIAGIDKETRKKRAIEVLDKVGLQGEYNKRPNQLSGGQQQRVSIARALINNPEILLADEPTGALDTETSKQIMELMKEISKERLVIMVTHNSKIAYEYSTRIIKLEDGLVISDSNPYEPAELIIQEKFKYDKKSKLSIWSAVKLSSRNLISKLRRTVLVCIAGSIGIIGIASVLSLSQGVTNYVDDMQNDMLTGNPITIDETGINIASFMETMSMREKQDALQYAYKDGHINIFALLENLVKRQEQLTSFGIKNEIDEVYQTFIKEMPEDKYGAYVFDYNYNVNNNIYTVNPFTGHEGETISIGAITHIYSRMLSKNVGNYSNVITGLARIFNPLPNNKDYILDQSVVVASKGDLVYPENINQVMLVLNDDQASTDVLLAQLGYYTQDEFLNVMYKTLRDDKYDSSLDITHFSYEEIMAKKFIYFPNDTVYTENTNEYTKNARPFTYSPSIGEWDNGLELELVSIIAPKPGKKFASLDPGIYYTTDFNQKFLNDNIDSKVVNHLLDKEQEEYVSTLMVDANTGISMPVGITYKYTYIFETDENGDPKEYTEDCFVGTIPPYASFLSAIPGLSSSDAYSLSLRDIGGNNMPKQIKIYSTDFDQKDLTLEYLDLWSSDKKLDIGGVSYKAKDRNKIIYTDNLSVIIKMIQDMIEVITIALIVFTALSLVVSSVMIAIITYVSVIEREKEIGVIRALGGRKRDVSNLFNVETFIIGLISGIFGIVITYLITVIVNVSLRDLIEADHIAVLTLKTIGSMIALSIILTLISGSIPARMAAKKDPAEALRTE